MQYTNVFDYNLTRMREVSGVTREEFEEGIRPEGKPVILRGVVADWPAVQAGQQSYEALASYLKALDTGVPASTYVATASVQGRYFYSPDLTGFNFDKRDIPLSATIDKLLAQVEAKAPLGIYAGASPVANSVPGFGAANAMPLVNADVAPLIWVGNSARIAPHCDTSENVACSVAGERRFLVFPPEQVSNLYIGPIDHNMAGQPASLVDPIAIDRERFPKFEQAIGEAQLAELAPGDAIYLPSLWWHYVESSGPFNVLVNYWWSNLDEGSPMSALALAILLIRDLPVVERRAWESLFHHYIFGQGAGAALDHVPQALRGVLASKSPQRDERVKAFLRNQLMKTLS